MAASKEVDAQSDIWSVGATLFALLTGRYVHHASTPNELLVKTATEPPPSLRSVWNDAPDCIVAVIDKALARDKSQRWRDARTMRAALKAARESLGLALDVPRSSAPPTQREAAAFAETVGSDPNRVDSQPSPRTPSQLGNLTTAHDVASSVSVRVPAALSGGRSKKRWLAAVLAGTLLGGVAIGVTLVVRNGQTATAAPPSEPVEPPAAPVTVTTAAPPETAEPRVEPSPLPAVDAGSAAAKPPVRAPVPVRPAERRPAPPVAPPPASASGPSIPWDVR
jgi:serine/threonine-protein kinase